MVGVERSPTKRKSERILDHPLVGITTIVVIHAQPVWTKNCDHLRSQTVTIVSENWIEEIIFSEDYLGKSQTPFPQSLQSYTTILFTKRIKVLTYIKYLFTVRRNKGLNRQSLGNKSSKESEYLARNDRNVTLNSVNYEFIWLDKGTSMDCL